MQVKLLNYRAENKGPKNKAASQQIMSKIPNTLNMSTGCNATL